MGDVEDMIGALEDDEDEPEEEAPDAEEEDEEEDSAFGLDLDAAWSSPERDE